LAERIKIGSIGLLKKLFIFIFLLYISGFPSRLGLIPQAAHEIIIMIFAAIGIAALALYMGLYRYKVDKIDIFLLILLFLYPFFSSITAWIIVRQPVYMGLLTFRGSFILLTFYTLIILGFSGNIVLSYSRITVIFIIAIVAVLFYFFGLNDFNLFFHKGTLAKEYTMTTTKGIQFSGYTCLFIVPYIAGWVKYFEKNKPVYLWLPFFIFLFSVMISKARNEILTLAVLPLFMYYFKYKINNVKFLIYTFLLVTLFFMVIFTENAVSRNFSGLLRPSDLGYAYETGDYSAYLRFEELKQGWSWFLKYPVTGVGSLSYRYNDGYLGLISDIFFVSDIGIMGVLVKGGIILLLLYSFLYNTLFNYFRNDDLVSVTGRFLTLALLIELIIGNDYLFNYTGVMVILFMLRPARKPKFSINFDPVKEK
jgi:hypothetical protein